MVNTARFYRNVQIDLLRVNDGYVDVLGTIKGTPASADEVERPSPDLVDPDLGLLTEFIPADERYSYSFRGEVGEPGEVSCRTESLPPRMPVLFALLAQVRPRTPGGTTIVSPTVVGSAVPDPLPRDNFSRGVAFVWNWSFP